MQFKCIHNIMYSYSNLCTEKPIQVNAVGFPGFLVRNLDPYKLKGKKSGKSGWLVSMSSFCSLQLELQGLRAFLKDLGKNTWVKPGQRLRPNCSTWQCSKNSCALTFGESFGALLLHYVYSFFVCENLNINNTNKQTNTHSYYFMTNMKGSKGKTDQNFLK